MWFDVALRCGIYSMVDKLGMSKNYKKRKNRNISVFCTLDTHTKIFLLV